MTWRREQNKVGKKAIFAFLSREKNTRKTKDKANFFQYIQVLRKMLFLALSWE
jgi:hypothetical protein